MLGLLLHIRNIRNIPMISHLIIFPIFLCPPNLWDIFVVPGNLWSLYFSFSLVWFRFHCHVSRVGSLCRLSYKPLWLPSNVHHRMPDLRCQPDYYVLCHPLDNFVCVVCVSWSGRSIYIFVVFGNRQEVFWKMAIYRPWNCLCRPRLGYNGS